MPVSIQYDDHSKRSHSVSYYSRPGDRTENNTADNASHLAVNCTGIVDLPFPFTTSEADGRRDFYLLYMLGGQLDAHIGGARLTVSAGDAVLIPPATAYAYTKSSRDDVRYLWVHFTGRFAGELLARYSLDGAISHRLGFDEGIQTLFMQIIEDFIRRDEYFLDSAAARLTAIFIAMRRRLDSLAECRRDSVGRIFSSIKYIHDNFRRPITNEELAGIEHLSVSQYIELFRRCTGTTPRSYVIELRIRSACDMLTTLDLTVAQIAEAVGYDDAHYFSRIFKTHRGVCPDEYRRNGGRP